MIYVSTKFHMLNLNDSLVIGITPKAKMYTRPPYFFYILQNISLTNMYFIFQELMTWSILGP
jgi:hypothetical protein